MKTDHHSNWLKKQIAATERRGFTPAEALKFERVKAEERKGREVDAAWKQLARDDRRAA